MHEVMRTITESIGNSPIQIRRNRVGYIKEEDNQTYNNMKKEARKLAKEMARIQRNKVKKSTETLQVVASERGPAISAPVLVWKTQAHRKQSLL